MCDAKRVGDQMMCGRCGIQWDHDDPDGDSCCPMNAPPVENAPIARSLSVTSMWRKPQLGSYSPCTAETCESGCALPGDCLSGINRA